VKRFDDLEQVADYFMEDGATIETVRQLVDALVVLGKNHKVYAYHDDFMGLNIDLPDEFLRMYISDLGEDEFGNEIVRVLEEANTIVNLYERNLSEYDDDYIREDRQSRGDDLDD